MPVDHLTTKDRVRFDSFSARRSRRRRVLRAEVEGRALHLAAKGSESRPARPITIDASNQPPDATQPRLRLV